MDTKFYDSGNKRVAEAASRAENLFLLHTFEKEIILSGDFTIARGEHDAIFRIAWRGEDVGFISKTGSATLVDEPGAPSLDSLLNALRETEETDYALADVRRLRRALGEDKHEISVMLMALRCSSEETAAHKAVEKALIHARQLGRAEARLDYTLDNHSDGDEVPF